jgi:hypothetical protein
MLHNQVLRIETRSLLSTNAHNTGLTREGNKNRKVFNVATMLDKKKVNSQCHTYTFSCGIAANISNITDINNMNMEMDK